MELFKNKLIILVIIGILGSVLFVTLPNILSNKSETISEEKLQFLTKHNLNDLSVEEMVSTLDQTISEKSGFYASITSETLTLIDADNEFKYDTPEDQFYLSFAPYINNTHPCANHNLVTCRGELQNETVNVEIKDSTGTILINDQYTTMDNGFIGIWLPKNMDVTITVNHQGLTATQEISTYSGDNTCLTTLKMSE
ncbi:CueP family metal-binding protein [Haloplasma contractile]|uniref:Periplasmic protein n=1 Tax=Haloplasma contractile SSD-17B TaxID=1033810 RepID=U2FJY1_9MOLU|nr:CueP family metal-binding protein [Haloplasma contractile]ERJ13125.1 Putative periplasmic protein [Haloplasma contractile SSD-17B]